MKPLDMLKTLDTKKYHFQLKELDKKRHVIQTFVFSYPSTKVEMLEAYKHHCLMLGKLPCKYKIIVARNK
jgi:hypothetical protein